MSASLKEELKDPAYDGMTAAQALARLNETIEISTDETAYTYPGLSEKLQALGVSVAILTTLDTTVAALPGGSMLDKMLLSGGVNFASTTIQQQLLMTLPNVTGDAAIVVQGMLDVGVTNGKRWEAFQSNQPTEAEVQSAIDSIALDNLDSYSRVTYDAAWNKRAAGDKTGAAADLRSLATMWET